jgi:hypothetical protein
VGTAATIRADLARFASLTNPDELIATAQIFDHAARLRSFEILANVVN